METQFLTCSFSLREPTKKKKEVLDYAFDQYTNGTTSLLDIARNNLSNIEEYGQKKNKKGEPSGKWDAQSIAKMLPSSGSLYVDVAAEIKDAMCADASASLASYFELRKIDENTGFPSAFVDKKEQRNEALNHWGLDYSEDNHDKVASWFDLESESNYKKLLIGRAKKTARPIYFSRSRSFAILMNPDDQTFYAWLPVLSGSNNFLEKPLTLDDRFINVASGLPVSQDPNVRTRSKSAILVPLEIDIDGWQYERFILPTINKKASIKSAKLLRVNIDCKERYLLNVSFEFECEDAYEPEAYLGIDRGILFTVAYGVVTTDGRIIEKSHFDDGLRSFQLAVGKEIQRKSRKGQSVTAKDYKTKAKNEVLHTLVNYVIDLAIEHKAAIVLEDLNVQVSGSFVRSSWAKLEGYLRYKAVLAGVPIYGNVFAAKTSLICIHCGGDIIEHKRIGLPVICSECGKSEHADEAAGVNIARRALYRKREWQSYREFHRSFSQA